MALKKSAPLATLLPTVPRRGHVNRVGVNRPILHQHFPFRTPTATQLRQLSENHKSRAEASATASEKTASARKEGRISVLDRMGANRTTKIVIIVFLSVYGTMETLFYANAAYRYFSKEDA
ncbi:hypothetical protein N8I77_012008 [Diaporthe amygdali]|uniref:Uncharacterized protein n=1 Tax=Phomopsis amygdali TaxID=1214568 RepID=A0AAD9S3W7_PHOAM|nr:hypothetical protein N8I77_012008 [Diaporthe amygdali]